MKDMGWGDAKRNTDGFKTEHKLVPAKCLTDFSK